MSQFPRHQLRYSSTYLGLLVSLSWLTLAHAQKADTIFPIDGTAIRGRVSEVTRLAIRFNAQGKDQQLWASDVRAISFGGEPLALRQARDFLEENQLEQAEQAMQRVSLEDLDRLELKHEYAYVRAMLKVRQAESGVGDAASAARELLGFLKNAKESFHYFSAMRSLGDIAMQMGSYDNAAKYYSGLAAAPWPAYKITADVLQGDALRAAGPQNNAAAIAKYDAAIALAATTAAMERLKALAIAGKAASAAEMGEAATSIATLEELIADNDDSDSELFAKLYNALGDCYRANGSPSDAALAYLHVDLLFNRDASTHAESLFRLSQIWGELGKPARAAEARNLLKTRYASTAWAKR